MQQLRLLSIAIAVSALAASSADARPKAKPKQSAAAKAHIDKATKAHKDGKFDVALTELQAAYDITPDPKLLFAIAQVQAKLGDCLSAIDNYNKFLDATKDKKKQDVVKQAIAACRSKDADAFASPHPDDNVFRKEKPADPVLDTAPTPPTTPAVTTTPPPSPIETTPPPVESPPPPIVHDEPLPPPQQVDTPHHRAFYKDALGDVLVVGGITAGVFSFIEFSAAKKSLDDAENASTLDAYNNLVDDAHGKRTLSLILAGGSVVLVGAGIVRFAVHGSRESHHVAVVPSHGGGLVTWSGGF